MCQAMTGDGAFDPETCPMLKGLPREEQRSRMASDRRIAACIAAMNGGHVLRPVSDSDLPCQTLSDDMPEALPLTTLTSSAA